jgi:ABC-2 type transport system ATP-binding protein
MDQALVIEGLVKQFGNHVVAVDRFSLSVAPGEVFGLIGPDGAGKTTTMRLVAGLMAPDSGTITVLGFDIARETRRARVSVGYMPQQYSLYGDLSVQENLRFFAGMYGVPKRAMLEREKRLLGIARLEEFRGRPAAALSGGMYKKLALSCALIHSPKLLLLDEPTNGVDPISRRELWAFFEELVDEGVAVFVSTPYMDEAERCDRVGLLVEGKIVATGTPRDLKSRFQSTVFEITTADGLHPSGIFSGASGVDQIYAVGRKLHIVSTQGPAFAASIEAILRDHNVQGARVNVVPPSFEDIFLDISSRAAIAGARS